MWVWVGREGGREKGGGNRKEKESRRVGGREGKRVEIEKGKKVGEWEEEKEK